MSFPNQQAKPVDTTALDMARADSRDCPFCDGEGMITVYAPGYTGCEIAMTRDSIPYVARTTGHCICKLGRYMRSQTKEDIRKRIPDIDDVAQGRSRWLTVDPTEKPCPNADDPVDEASFRKWWRRIRVSRIAKQIP